MLAKGLLTQTQLKIALETRAKGSRRLGDVIIALGFATEMDIAQCLAEQYMIELVIPKELQVDPAATRLVPSSYALSHVVLPYKIEGQWLHCCVADPLDVATTDELASATQKIIKLSISPSTQLKDAIIQAYDIPIVPAPSIAIHPDKKQRKGRIDSQEDRFALLDALAHNVGGSY